VRPILHLTGVGEPVSDAVLMARYEQGMARYRLAPQQCAVARGVFRYSYTPDIASTLGLTCATVRNHMRAIRDKTGARSQTEVVLILLGVIDASPPCSH